MRLFFNTLEKYATGKIIAAGLILVLIFNLILFPFLFNFFNIQHLSIKNILDLKYSYTINEAYELFNKLGENGRNIYRLAEIFIDIPYLLIYSIVYSLMIIALLKSNKLTNLYFLTFAPILIGFFDILENLGIVVMLTKYPIKLNHVCNLTAIFTSLKWNFAVATFLIILLSGLYLIFTKTVERLKKSKKIN
ncbi:MAG: hypothetical protein PHW92_10220 [Lutibacter sp.]|nr:hypothetical protein [Lutibacter sp.]